MINQPPLKTFLTYSLLILFLTSVIRPVFPVVNYMVNFDHIAKVLCIKKEIPENSCKGKCYLIQQTEEKKEADSSVPQTQWEVQLLSLHKPMNYNFFFEQVPGKLIFASYQACLKSRHFTPATPPPEQKSSSILA